METIFITGAGGFVGGTIVEALFFNQQYNIRAGIARWSSAPRIARFPISLVQCDILKPAELDEAFASVDYVIHCAVGDEKVIIDGTRNVLAAARKAGVKRVIMISSVAVYGGADGQITEDTTAPAGTLTGYGAAKIEAEKLCHEYDNVVILRPTIIYGPFSAQWTTLYARRLQSGNWKQLGEFGDGLCNLVHVHDVARFAIAACKQDGVLGKTFNINGPELITWNQYFEQFNAHLGLPAMTKQTGGKTRLRALALSPIRIVGKYALKHHASKLSWLSRRNERLRKLMLRTEQTLKFTPNSDELTLFRLKAHYVSTEAESAFGFPANFRIKEGLAMSAAWLAHMGEV